jgi:hypothetical protein
MGANSGQIAKLKARQAKRGYGFQSNDERNKTAPAKTQSQISQRNTVKPKTSMDKHVSNVASNRDGAEKSALAKKDNVSRIRTSASPTGLRRDPNAPKPGAPKPEPKGGALATRPADKGASIVRSKNYKEPTAVGRPDEKKSAIQPGTTRNSVVPKTNTRTVPQETKEKKPVKKGFVSGVKSSLGGDVFDKNDSNRLRARRQLGMKTGNAIKSAPGKVVRTAGSLLKKSMPKITSQSVGGSDAEIKGSDVKSYN